MEKDGVEKANFPSMFQSCQTASTSVTPSFSACAHWGKFWKTAELPPFCGKRSSLVAVLLLLLTLWKIAVLSTPQQTQRNGEDRDPPCGDPEPDEQQRKEVKKDGPSNTSSSNSVSGSSTTGEASRKKRSRSHSKSRDRKCSCSRDWDWYRRRNSRSRSRDRQRRHSSHSRDCRHSSESRSRDQHHEDCVCYRSPPLATGHRYGQNKSPRFREKSPVREPVDNLSPEERDARTVFCMQLAARIRPRDLEDFFSAVGKVRDVRIISDRNSRRSKGIAYVEFCEIQSVPLAIRLTGQRLLGVPIIVQASQAEKNRLAAMANNLQKGSGGPMRLFVGSLHFNITEDMLRGIFEPFGKIDNIVLMKDSDTGRSKGYGFITALESSCQPQLLLLPPRLLLPRLLLPRLLPCS
ncbi:probable RNA-binding protein 23 [Sturnira hondurensis]|uniref:probable RNA-binding protein 23 n=1 Tax=Sturnira hondurensis TaxID=192404 RepID=UPI00187A1214|nr:probable RNA-binding protein 23 [Sturnira hondurensis]